MNAISAVVWLLLVVVLAVVFAAIALLTRAAPLRIVAGGGQALSWPKASCVSPDAVAACFSAVRRPAVRASFGFPTEAERTELERAAASIAAKHREPVTYRQLNSLRTMETVWDARKSGVRAMQLGPELKAEAGTGGDPAAVLAAARRHRLPPCAVWRQLALEAGETPAAARERPPPAEVAAADLSSRASCETIRAEADSFERAIEKFLRDSGVAFKTENDLRDDPHASGFTPDFLLDPPALVSTPDGEPRPVHWIDAKNFPAFGSRLVEKKLAATADKYHRAFGPGAMVFSGGVACGITVGNSAPEPLLLDGSFLV